MAETLDISQLQGKLEAAVSWTAIAKEDLEEAELWAQFRPQWAASGLAQAQVDYAEAVASEARLQARYDALDVLAA